MRILLVNPRFPESLWGFSGADFSREGQYVVATLALPVVAGLTPPGHDVVIVDENVDPVPFDDPADIVGVTSMSVQAMRAFEIAAEFRRRGRTVVMGGVYATISPKTCRPHADVLFLGEVETTWPAFLSDYARGVHRDTYISPGPDDLGRAPIPRFDLLRIGRYESIPVQFTRGCPHTCEFCDVFLVSGRRPRTKPIPQILSELDAIHRLGGREVFFSDDNFLGNRRATREMLHALRDWNRDRGNAISFVTQVSLDVADNDEILSLMRDCRFARLLIGIESPRAASLAEAGKHMNLRGPMEDRVRRIQSWSIQVTANFIVGFDGDDSSIFEEQSRFARDARIPVVAVGLLQAIPGTPLHDRLGREGRLRPGAEGCFPSPSTNIIPKGMSLSEMLTGTASLNVSLYDPGSFAERAVAYLTCRREAEPVRADGVAPEEARRGRILLKYAAGRWREDKAEVARKIFSVSGDLPPERMHEATVLAMVYGHFRDYSLKAVWESEEKGSCFPAVSPDISPTLRNPG